MRRCAATRERLPKERMIRFVVGPDRAVVPDLAGRLPGRGIWLSARRDVLETGRRPVRPDAGLAPRSPKLAGLFARAAKGPVTVPDDLAELLRVGLERRIGELLGLARRAGQAVAGFEKAGEIVRAGRAGLIVQAADGSRDERARFASAETARRLGLKIVSPLDAARLGAVFGRERAVHVALTPGKLAEAVGHEADRLAGVAGADAADLGDEGAAGLDKDGAETNFASDEMGKTHT